MKVAFACSVLVLTTSLFAQQSGQSAQFRVMQPAATGCPVSFAAQVDARLVARTVDNQHKNPDGPLVRLTFDPARPILSASVVIHGMSRKGLTLPVAQQASEDIREHFKLSPQRGSHFVADDEVRVTSMAIVRSAEIREFRFADGSTWHPSGDERCQAAPSLFRDVALTAQ